MDTHKVCCFIGHRNVKITEQLKNDVKNVVEKLINEENVSTFILGSRSTFNDLCHEIVSELKENYPFIKRVCMPCRHEACILEKNRAEQERIYSDLFKREVHLLGFEEEWEFKNKYTAGKAGYLERNQAMIDLSDFCVFYFDDEYLPPERLAYERSLFLYQPKSGTALSYKYAKQKKKHIINMFKNN